MLDTGAWGANLRETFAPLAAAVQQGLTTGDRLLAELGKRPRQPDRRLLSLTLHDIGGGAHSLAELDFTALCRRAGLPDPLHQQVRRDPSGRRRYLDVVMRRRDGSTFAVEIDGALHLQPETYWDDMSRGNNLVISGMAVLRFPALALRMSPDAVVDQLRRMYESPGR